MKKICVFCGSSLGHDESFIESARHLGILLAKKNIQLVYGGANVGLMGTVAKACLDNGGEVVGIIPEKLVAMEVASDNLTELKIVKTMHERKSLMSDLAHGFIALPGGIGTLEETLEVFTWLQLGISAKPVALLNVSGFFDYLVKSLEHMVDCGFMSKEHLDMLIVESTPEKIIERLENYRHIYIEKWFDKEKNRVV